MIANKRILVVAAHPDDELLGCGGSLAKWADAGHSVFVQILGEGLTSRSDSAEKERKSTAYAQLHSASEKVANILKVSNLRMEKFPDNAFDKNPLLQVVKAVEAYKNMVRPDWVLTHSAVDLNIDHQMTHQAVLTAFRPLPGEKCVEIRSFETLSASEWNFGRQFKPQIFVDIQNFIEIKLEAMRAYISEIRDFPHPRSLRGIEVLAAYRGMQAGLDYAEAFELIRKNEE